jgi:Cu/Ag efflux pump CusA
MNWRTTADLPRGSLPLSLARGVAGPPGQRRVDQHDDPGRLRHRHRRAGGRRDHRRGERVQAPARERGAPGLEKRRSALDVVYAASSEIRGSVVFATAIILLVFAPLFFLSGIEGRLLQPLGVAYVTSIGASLVVALTITPVLCLLLLGRHTTGHAPRARELRGAAPPAPVPACAVGRAACAPRAVAALSVVGAVAALATLASFGRSFLPEFNEGSLNIAAATAPGTSLATSDEIVSRLERFLIAHPAVTSVIRTTGPRRARRARHGRELLRAGGGPRPGEGRAGGRPGRDPRAGRAIPGLSVTVGQPISHRIEHLVSGVRANLAVKVFGPDLEQLRTVAQQADVLRSIPGLVDVAVEQQTEIPQLVCGPSRPSWRPSGCAAATSRASWSWPSPARPWRRGTRTSAPTTWWPSSPSST